MSRYPAVNMLVQDSTGAERNKNKKLDSTARVRRRQALNSTVF